MQLAAYHNYRNAQDLADSAASEQVQLNASRDLLDRGGLGAKHAVEPSTKPSEPWEEVLADAMQDPWPSVETEPDERTPYTPREPRSLER